MIESWLLFMSLKIEKQNVKKILPFSLAHRQSYFTFDDDSQSNYGKINYNTNTSCHYKIFARIQYHRSRDYRTKSIKNEIILSNS